MHGSTFHPFLLNMLKTFRFKFYFACLCFLLFKLNGQAQFTPYFQNYLLSEYSAGNQNWGVSRAKNGKVYVANNNGLLEYDGLKWHFKQLPNKTTLRSVLAYKDRIYTGSYEEFGYWTHNTKGELVYNSLSDSVKDEASLNEEIWQIIPFKDMVVFRSFLNIYIYEVATGRIVKLNAGATIISCSIVNDELLVATLRNGVYRLENEKLIPVINHPLLINTKVVSIVDYNSGLLIATALKGCFFYKETKLEPLNFSINSYLKQHQLNEFSLLENGNMVFGTIKNGVYITNNTGEVVAQINKENGLVNNTVLGHCVDGDVMWLGLDNGLASVELGNQNYFYNDVTGKLGAVYGVVRHEDLIYIGSNTGLFYLEENKLQFVSGSQGQVWYIKKINGELFCGHNNGTFLIKDKKLVSISNFTGGWTLKKVPELNNVYVEGTYAGLVRFEKGNGRWSDKHLGKTTMPIRFLVFEDQNMAWAAHAYKGLYRVKFSNNYDSIINLENYGRKGVFSDFNVRVYNIKNEICFKTNDGWMKYEPMIDSIVPYKILDKNFGKNSYLISEEDAEELVLKKGNGAIGFKNLTNNDQDLWLSGKYFENRLIVGYENISKIADSTYALNLIDGFMLIDKTKSLHAKTALYKPSIDKISVNKKLIELDLTKNIDVDINSGLEILVSSPRSSNHFFEYAIKEADAVIWNRMDGNRLELSNLNNGDYAILFRSANTLGYKSEVAQLKLNVLPPWYKDTWGGVLYLALFILISTLIYIYNKRKVELEQRLLKIKYAKEQQELLREKTLENEKRIVQLKNEALQNEVKLKSKQLANSAMALVKKNETLQELKKELDDNKEHFNNKYLYKKILKRVDNSIAHKDEWEIFEYNFNQVHEDFFKKLKSQHPNLTAKDLKICAYIKMNLTNKEIAPLMNISVRGIETHRYRLKKKLELENDISVASYLLNLE